MTFTKILPFPFIIKKNKDCFIVYVDDEESGLRYYMYAPMDCFKFSIYSLVRDILRETSRIDMNKYSKPVWCRVMRTSK